MSDPLEPQSHPRGPAGGGWPEAAPSDPEAPKMSEFEQQGQEMPAGAEKMAGASKIIYPVFAALGSIAFPLIVAAVFLALNLVGGRLRFPVSYSVLLHSGVP